MLKFEHEFAEPCGDPKTLMAEAMAQVGEEKESGRIGYYALPEGSMEMVEAVETYIENNPFMQNGDIWHIVVIGIGGSSLGVRAVDALLQYKNRGKRRLAFLDNADPIQIHEVLSRLTKETSLFIVASKSGSTIETTSIFKTVIDHFDLDLDGADRDRVIAITDEGSSLSGFADTHGIAQFNIPHNVGGRFSVLSAVGVVPLVLAGYDVRGLLEGAKRMMEEFFGGEAEHLLQKAVSYTATCSSFHTNVLFSYSSELEPFTKWYVQLWGESLGKKRADGVRTGLTPIGLIGSVDQHSFLQLIMEGPENKSVTFLKIEDFEDSLRIPDITLEGIEKTDYVNGHTYNELINKQCDATRESVMQSGVPTDMIVMEHIDEISIGALIMYYQLLTSLAGAMLKINTYDQPGVELGKKILFEKFSE
jgi:glucose-6-phosphate isomerase